MHLPITEDMLQRTTEALQRFADAALRALHHPHYTVKVAIDADVDVNEGECTRAHVLRSFHNCEGYITVNLRGRDQLIGGFAGTLVDDVLHEVLHVVTSEFALAYTAATKGAKTATVMALVSSCEERLCNLCVRWLTQEATELLPARYTAITTIREVLDVD